MDGGTGGRRVLIEIRDPLSNPRKNGSPGWSGNRQDPLSDYYPITVSLSDRCDDVVPGSRRRQRATKRETTRSDGPFKKRPDARRARLPVHPHPRLHQLTALVHLHRRQHVLVDLAVLERKVKRVRAHAEEFGPHMPPGQIRKLRVQVFAPFHALFPFDKQTEK